LGDCAGDRRRSCRHQKSRAKGKEENYPRPPTCEKWKKDKKKRQKYRRIGEKNQRIRTATEVMQKLFKEREVIVSR